mmetsp:Transcript_7115/g.16169  ORF Transcript_7115/g.16169 Transcript_7115/m.16169 type:complete len:233 (+) Transcript_7115:301-999(+)
MNTLYRRNYKHGLHQNILGDRPQPTRSRSSAECHLCNFLQCTLCCVEANSIHGKLEGVLLDERILGNCQNVHQAILIEALGRDNYGESSDILGYHAKMNEIFGDGIVKVLALHLKVLGVFLHLGSKSNRRSIHSFVNYLLKACKCSAADEEDICCINLDEISPRILTPRFLGNINHISFNNFEQRMLHTFTRYVSTNTNIPSALANLVNLINIYNAPLAALQILSTLNVQLE